MRKCWLARTEDAIEHRWQSGQVIPDIRRNCHHGAAAITILLSGASFAGDICGGRSHPEVASCMAFKSKDQQFVFLIIFEMRN